MLAEAGAFPTPAGDIPAGTPVGLDVKMMFRVSGKRGNDVAKAWLRCIQSRYKEAEAFTAGLTLSGLIRARPLRPFSAAIHLCGK